MVLLSAVQTVLIVKRLVSSATAGPLAPSRSVSLYVFLVELLAGLEVVLLIRVQGSKPPSGLWGFVRWAAGAALQRELAKQKTRIRLKESPRRISSSFKGFCTFRVLGQVAPQKQGSGQCGSATLPASRGELKVFYYTH